MQQLEKEFLKLKILNEFGYTLAGDALFYLGTVIQKNYEFVVFHSDFVANFIEEKIPVGCWYYLMDGTFDSLPRGVYQLLTISIAYENNVSVSNVSLLHPSVRNIYIKNFRYSLSFTAR